MPATDRPVQAVVMAKWFGQKEAQRSLRPTLDELLVLVRRYLMQETLGSLKRIAKGIAIALAGALSYAVGSVIVLVGVLRVLQGETGQFFAGTWSFAPYFITAVGGLVLTALAAVVTLRAIASWTT